MVTLQVKLLRSLKDKSIGLIGAKKPYPIYLTTRWGIHTFGVLSPIDVMILDKNNRVVKIVLTLLPNRLFFWPPIYKNVVELPAGEIKRKRVKIGDQLTLRFLDD